MTIQILIADDHTIFRRALRDYLEKEKDFKVVGEAGDGPRTIELAKKIEADVLLLDIGMPGGISAAKIVEELARKCPKLAVVVLTAHQDEFYVKELLKAGAKGFILKESTGEILSEAIRASHNQKFYVDPAISGYLIPSYTHRPVESKSDKLSILTQREKEVCRLLALGYTNSEIADKLFISARTVETHRANIMEKLELKTRAELVRLAIDYNLLKLE